MNPFYPDLENNFPNSVDNIDRMGDLTIYTKPLADQYNELMESGDVDAAQTFLQTNPSLAISIFNAKKFNALRDAIVSVQRMFINDIDEYIIKVSGGNMYQEHYDSDQTVRKAGGIVAYVMQILQSLGMMKSTYDASGEVGTAGGIVAYTDKRVNGLYSVSVTLPSNGWVGDAAPYTQTITVDGMTEDWKPGQASPDSTEVVTLDGKIAVKEAFACINEITSGTNALTFTCFSDKPAITISVDVPGLMRGGA